MNVDSLSVSCFTIPTDAPESDGTNEWDSTTIVIVEARAGTTHGLGWTYAPEAAGTVVDVKPTGKVDVGTPITLTVSDGNATAAPQIGSKGSNAERD